MEKIRVAFEYADKEKKGELTKHQYKIAMTVLFGCCPEKLETRQTFGYPGKTAISFEEFVQWVRKKGFFHNTTIDAKTLFLLLDTTFTGHIEMRDFYYASELADLKVRKSTWRKAYNEMDRRRRGFLDLGDLELLLNTQCL